MDLLTTWLRSIRYRVESEVRRETSAAIVLPVPLAPANSGLFPRPRRLRSANPQRSYTVVR